MNIIRKIKLSEIIDVEFTPDENSIIKLYKYWFTDVIGKYHNLFEENVYKKTNGLFVFTIKNSGFISIRYDKFEEHLYKYGVNDIYIRKLNNYFYKLLVVNKNNDIFVNQKI